MQAAPIATLDLASAVPTWLARYRQAKIAGENEGMAIYLADTSVRQAHGSSAITSRAQLMRQNLVAGLAGNFYTFFSHILQRQVEWTWEARARARGEGYYFEPPKVGTGGVVEPPRMITAAERRQRIEETEGEYKNTDDYKNAQATVPVMAGLLVAYFALPAWVDELVSPMHGEKGIGPDKNESWLWYAAKVEARGLGGSWLFLRDVFHWAVEGGDISAGMWGEFAKTVQRALKHTTPSEMEKRTTLKQKQNMIKNYNAIFNSIGGLGMPNSLPRMGVFGANWHYGSERPQSFREFWTGITRGTVHPRH
jgi:hypothetical protein